MPATRSFIVPMDKTIAVPHVTDAGINELCSALQYVRQYSNKEELVDDVGELAAYAYMNMKDKHVFYTWLDNMVLVVYATPEVIKNKLAWLNEKIAEELATKPLS